MQADPDLVAFANRLADASGAVIRPFFRRPIPVDHKQGVHAFDPVTQADRGAEEAIRALIRAERPGDAVLGEEFGETPGHSGYRWVLDPVDGTRAFITGRHEWGSLIALEKDGAPILGVLDQPVLGERFIGDGAQSWLQQAGRRTDLKTRACAGLEDAILCATDPAAYFDPPQLAAFQALAPRTRMTRFGGDCYLFAALAMGFVDLIVEANFHRWDAAALIPLVEGAGGVMTDWRGGSCIEGKTILAAGDKRVHAAAMALLGGA